MEEIIFVDKKSMYYNPLSGDRKNINLREIYFWEELISADKKLFC